QLSLKKLPVSLHNIRNVYGCDLPSYGPQLAAADLEQLANQINKRLEAFSGTHYHFLIHRNVVSQQTSMHIFQIPRHSRNRRFELMCDHGHKLRFLRIEALELRHILNRTDETEDLARRIADGSRF